MQPDLRSWKQRVQDAKQVVANGDFDRLAYADANLNFVSRFVNGLGPDGAKPAEGAGARAVVNMACAHVPSFTGQGYLNTYQLHLKGLAPTASKRRQSVDDVLQGLTGIAPDRSYFAAVSLNKSGVRFYGDMTLVLKADLQGDGPHLLDRNSYDLMRAPIAGCLPHKDWVCSWHGRWTRDLADMLSLRALYTLPSVKRRWAAGQVARAALDDEDYVEFIGEAQASEQCFDLSAVQEVRLSSADVALEAWIGERVARGPAPAASLLLWRQQRHDAVDSLVQHGIKVGVNTEEGRSRG